MQQLLLELADVAVGMRIADDAVDLAGDPDVPAADVAHDHRAAFGRQFARVRAEPVVVLDRRFDPAVLGQVDPHGRQGAARVLQISEELLRFALPEVQPERFRLDDAGARRQVDDLGRHGILPSMDERNLKGIADPLPMHRANGLASVRLHHRVADRGARFHQLMRGDDVAKRKRLRHLVDERVRPEHRALLQGL